jgi:hypothetical protein
LVIPAARPGRGVVSSEEHRVRRLVRRQDITGADRTKGRALLERIEAERHRERGKRAGKRASTLRTKG